MAALPWNWAPSKDIHDWSLKIVNKNKFYKNWRNLVMVKILNWLTDKKFWNLTYVYILSSCDPAPRFAAKAG